VTTTIAADSTFPETEDERNTTPGEVETTTSSEVEDIVHRFTLNIGQESTEINEITTKLPEVQATELPNATDPPSDTTIALQDDKVEDITQAFEITFETPPVETTSPASLTVDTTILFFEQDSSCLSGLVCGGRCLARHQVCDGLQDCEGGQDEAGCGFPSCEEGEFACLKGRCIPEEWKCDGRSDCSEGEDEVACASSCTSDQFLCSEGRCIDQTAVCDGHRDCGEGEDEFACGCGASDFQCQYGGGCVSLGSRCDGRMDCADRSDELECSPSLEPSCADWSLGDDLTSQLVGGDQESSIQWPTLALLFNVKSATSCTVSIISSLWLVTSHTCLAPSADPLQWVLFGGPSGNRQDNKTQIRIVRDIISHPWARKDQHLNAYDVALVRLHDPLQFSGEVGSLCLATEEVSPRQLCVSAGWAETGAGVSFQQYPTYLPEPLVPTATCNSSSLFNGKLTEGMVCSKANGDSAICHEDAGAPLMCLSGSRWQLQGVLSSHGGCRGDGPRPAVFTSVPAIRDWILATIGLS